MPQPATLPASSQPVDIHEGLNRVRHLPEFQPTPPDDTWEKLQHHPMVRSFLDSLQETLDHLAEAMARLFSEIKPPSAFGHDALFEQLFRGTVLFLIFFGILLLLYFVLTFLRGCLDRLPKAKPTSPLLVNDMVLQDRCFHEQQAKIFAQEGQYSRAVCHLYLAFLCALDESGIVLMEPSRTNREYLLFLRRKNQLAVASCFQQVARLFERVRFGQKPIVQSDYETCLQDYEACPLKGKPHV